MSRARLPEGDRRPAGARGRRAGRRAPHTCSACRHELDWRGARAGAAGGVLLRRPVAAEAAARGPRCWAQSPIEVFGSSETGGIAWRQRAVHGERWPRCRMSSGASTTRRCCSRALRRTCPTSMVAHRRSRADAGHEGGFALLGRADRIVKIEEKRVSLSAMEAALRRRGCGRSARRCRCRARPRPRARRGRRCPAPPAGRCAQQGGKRGAERTRCATALPGRWSAWRCHGAGASCARCRSTRRARPPRRCWPSCSGPHAAAAWLEREATQGHVPSCVIDAATSPAFDGHFPAAPILPGVAQLDWAVELARGASRCAALPARGGAEVPAVGAARARRWSSSLHWQADVHSACHSLRVRGGRACQRAPVFQADGACRCLTPSSSIPVYNHARRHRRRRRAVRAHGLPCVLVDDGSEPTAPRCCERWRGSTPVQ